MIDADFESIWLIGTGLWFVMSLLLIRYGVMGKEGGATMIIASPLWMYTVVGATLITVVLALGLALGLLLQGFAWFIAKKEEK